MLKIIVCDDDHFTLHLTCELVTKAIQANAIAARIVCLAATGGELLNFIQNSLDSYLYFLDFDLGRGELNGLDVVRKIYQVDPKGKIVFVTSHVDKGMEILRSGVQAFGFIEKDPNRRNMIEEYSRYLKLAAPMNVAPPEAPSIQLQIGIEEKVCFAVSEIAYVDSVKTAPHCICYHTFDRSEVTVRDTMEHALEQLGADFIRCHRSVLINKNHVISLKKGLLKLSNGTSVPCAMGKQKAVLAQCFSGEGVSCD